MLINSPLRLNNFTEIFNCCDKLNSKFKSSLKGLG
jgi:hypothetical protein